MPKKFTQPLVSIIMPVYKSEKYVKDAIESITNQTYKNLEIIVIDDCSPDNSWEEIQKAAAKDARVKAFKNTQNIKQTRTRNKGISLAGGKYIGLMDSDDLRDLTSIEKQVNFLEQHREVTVVGTASEFCDDNMKHLNFRVYPTDDDEIRAKFFRYSPFCLASMVMRAEYLDKTVAYNASMEPAEDIDLAMRLGMHGKLANLAEPLYKVRTHHDSVTQTYARVMEQKTLYVRIKAIFEYGYKMTLADKFYFFVQISSMYLMPPRLRFWLFNKIRAS